MSRIEKYTGWKTSDGAMFTRQQEAQRHQDKCDMLSFFRARDARWYELDELDLAELIQQWVEHRMLPETYE